MQVFCHIFCQIVLLGFFVWAEYIKNMKNLLVIFLLLLGGCQTVEVPPDFAYEIVQTKDFNLASWQKIGNPQAPYKIYIEGDGYAFNAHGYPSADPTPHSQLVRELAFGDPNPNVIYLARPCQYIAGKICSQRHWTTARFAPEVINAEFEAVRQIAGDNPVILVGFSGGAQVVGLIAATKPGLNVKKIITIGGNLDHTRWTEYHQVIPLNESMNLESYRRQFLRIPQHHYVGAKDKVMPPELVKNFVGDDKLVTVVPNAAHNSGWQEIFPLIWQEK